MQMSITGSFITSSRVSATAMQMQRAGGHHFISVGGHFHLLISTLWLRILGVIGKVTYFHCIILLKHNPRTNLSSVVNVFRNFLGKE